MVCSADHFGVPNVQLAREFPTLAQKYMNKSIAEQNRYADKKKSGLLSHARVLLVICSFNIAWDLFVDGPYDDLRKLLCPTQEELDRFRQLLINTLLATDIADEDLSK